MGTTLFIIDPQNDFMDKTDAALAVPGSIDDMYNLGDLIAYQGHQIDRIVVTLDQHPHHHIAHRIMWLNDQNKHPPLFTTISYDDIKANRWRASVSQNEQIQHEYVREAEEAGGSLTIWPPHCIIGSWGASVYTRLCYDLKNWANERRHVEFFPKSGNWSTEQYSSFRTVVPRFDDPSTLFNHRLYEAIQDDLILVAGEALSHCVAASVRDAIDQNPSRNVAQRMILLHNCTSPVPGCEKMADDFLVEFTRAGGRIMNSQEVLPVTDPC